MANDNGHSQRDCVLSPFSRYGADCREARTAALLARAGEGGVISSL